jgi:hypothetical protein
MKTIFFAYKHANRLSDELHRALWELSPMKRELAESFLVPLDYLKSWKQDIDNDHLKGFARPVHYDALLRLIADMESSGHKALFVCNDADLAI